MSGSSADDELRFFAKNAIFAITVGFGIRFRRGADGVKLGGRVVSWVFLRSR